MKHPHAHHPAHHKAEHVHHEHHVHHKKPEQKAQIYVGLPDTVAIRRPLLEAARLAIMTQPIEQKLQDIQDQKLAIRTNLSQVVKDMRNDVTRLKMVLPHRDVPVHHHEAHHTAAAPKKPIEHRVDKIAEALAAIEERMKLL